jgi:hypothetical protein
LPQIESIQTQKGFQSFFLSLSLSFNTLLAGRAEILTHRSTLTPVSRQKPVSHQKPPAA